MSNNYKPSDANQVMVDFTDEHGKSSLVVRTKSLLTLSIPSSDLRGVNTQLTGDDLRALRDLINELPERAFESPSFWSVGDAVVENDGGYLRLWEIQHNGLYCNKNIWVSPVTGVLRDDYSETNRLKRLIERGDERVTVVKRANAS